MQGLISMIAVSAVLSAGLVAGLAATDAAARPKTAAIPAPSIEAPAAETQKGGPSKTAAPCAAAAWPTLTEACAADGRKVRIIALNGR